MFVRKVFSFLSNATTTLYKGGYKNENISNVSNKDWTFNTSSAGKTVKQTSIRDILVKNNIEVLKEEFVCQGSFLVVGFRHPNKADIDAAISYAKEVIEKKVM